MERTATCACGQLGITVKGNPRIIAACNCTQCQKRTGSVFGVSAYFLDRRVLGIFGDSTVCSRTADSGLPITGNFCPKCGSTVYWKGDFIPGHTGVAVGCFADPAFPAPKVSVWNTTRHHWVNFPDTWAASDTQDF